VRARLGRLPGWALALGDAAAIALFAVLGLSAHESGITAAGLARNALPIVGAWFLLAPVLRTYAEPGARTLLVTWAAAVPVGVALRAVLLKRSLGAAELTFLGVTMAVTLALLSCWRAVAGLVAARRHPR
jgi:hypothetical protein